MNKVLFYFGCIARPGHYLWDKSLRTVNICYSDVLPKGVNVKLLERIDQTFVPPDGIECLYNVSIVPPLTIIAWADYSVDTRLGSNSALIAYGYSNVEEIFKAAKTDFPFLLARQKKQLELFVP